MTTGGATNCHAQPYDLTGKVLRKAVGYTTNRPDLVTISPTGLIQAITNPDTDQTVTVTATCDGKTATQTFVLTHSTDGDLALTGAFTQPWDSALSFHDNMSRYATTADIFDVDGWGFGTHTTSGSGSNSGAPRLVGGRLEVVRPVDGTVPTFGSCAVSLDLDPLVPAFGLRLRGRLTRVAGGSGDCGLLLDLSAPFFDFHVGNRLLAGPDGAGSALENYPSAEGSTETAIDAADMDALYAAGDVEIVQTVAFSGGTLATHLWFGPLGGPLPYHYTLTEPVDPALDAGLLFFSAILQGADVDGSYHGFALADVRYEPGDLATVCAAFGLTVPA